jgi:hypothetical protein
MTDMNPLQWIVLIGAAASALAYMTNKVAKLFKTWFKFIDDWYGTEEKPGITQRLNDGQDHFEKIDSELAIIKAELFNNGGSSLRDSIDRIERAVTKDKLN